MLGFSSGATREGWFQIGWEGVSSVLFLVYGVLRGALSGGAGVDWV